MFDNFINSFCKVQFLCYQGEPNWMGLIVLFPLVIIFFGSFAFIFVAVFGTIFNWLSGVGSQLYSEAINVFQVRPERNQKELEHLNRKQKVLRIIFLPFGFIKEFISWLSAVLILLLVIFVILMLLVKLIQVIYNYIV